MSQADLELCQELPKIRLVSPMIKQVQTPENSEAKFKIKNENENENDLIGRRREGDGDKDDDEDNCRTPTSVESRIPAVATCPPAPRKPAAGTAPACKRKLSEMDFFEAENRGEVEEFLGSASRRSFVKAKRNCVQCK